MNSGLRSEIGERNVMTPNTRAEQQQTPQPSLPQKRSSIYKSESRKPTLQMRSVSPQRTQDEAKDSRVRSPQPSGLSIKMNSMCPSDNDELRVSEDETHSVDSKPAAGLTAKVQIKKRINKVTAPQFNLASRPNLKVKNPMSASPGRKAQA